MRHLKAHRKLGRTTKHRISLLRNLATSLINARDERIITTLPKAKELRPFIERAITLSRRARALAGDEAAAERLHFRRQAAGYFHAGNSQQKVSTGQRGVERAPRTAGVAALKRLFDELGERFKDRNGGYTRIVKLGRREGDNAELALIELVDNPRERKASEAKSAKTASKKKSGGAKSDEKSNTKTSAKRAKKSASKNKETKE